MKKIILGLMLLSLSSFASDFNASECGINVNEGFGSFLVIEVCIGSYESYQAVQVRFGNDDVEIYKIDEDESDSSKFVLKGDGDDTYTLKIRGTLFGERTIIGRVARGSGFKAPLAPVK